MCACKPIEVNVTDNLCHIILVVERTRERVIYAYVYTCIKEKEKKKKQEIHKKKKKGQWVEKVKRNGSRDSIPAEDVLPMPLILLILPAVIPSPPFLCPTLGEDIFPAPESVNSEWEG